MTVAFIAPCPACQHDAAWREEEPRSEWRRDGWYDHSLSVQIDCHACEQETP